jgi:hypothetical protein
MMKEKKEVPTARGIEKISKKLAERCLIRQ